MVRGIVIEFGELPVMEDAEIVELLLDRAGHAGELLEVVGSTSRAGEALEAGRLRRRGNFLAHRMRRGADLVCRLLLEKKKNPTPLHFALLRRRDHFLRRTAH